MCRMCGGNPEEPSLPGKRSAMWLDKQVGNRILCALGFTPKHSGLARNVAETKPLSQAWIWDSQVWTCVLVPTDFTEHQSPEDWGLGLRLGHLLQNLPSADGLLASWGVACSWVPISGTTGRSSLTPFLGLTPGWLLLFVSMPFRCHILLLYLISSQNLLHPAAWSSSRCPLLLASMQSCTMRCNTLGVEWKEENAMPVLMFSMQCYPMEGKFRSLSDEEQNINLPSLKSEL